MQLRLMEKQLSEATRSASRAGSHSSSMELEEQLSRCECFDFTYGCQFFLKIFQPLMYCVMHYGEYGCIYVYIYIYIYIYICI